METVVVPKKALNKILTDVETLIDDVELAFSAKTKQRISDISSGKEKGKTEKEYYAYLAKRGITLGKLRR